MCSIQNESGLVKEQCLSHLVQNIDIIVGQVEKDQAAETAESSFSYFVDASALERQVGEVRCMFECSCRKLLYVITSQVQLNCDLGSAHTDYRKVCYMVFSCIVIQFTL